MHSIIYIYNIIVVVVEDVKVTIFVPIGRLGHVLIVILCNDITRNCSSICVEQYEC